MMGFDLVGLMMAVEDAFGFVIPDEDIAGLNTVGKLYEYIRAHRFHGKWQACLGSITCYKIRRAMISVLHIARNDVRVSTELAAIIPKHRRRVWRSIQKATGFRLPQLRRPRWVTATAVLATLGLAIAVPLLFSLTLFNGAILAGILTAFAVRYAFSWLMIPLAFEFHPECPTVGRLATATLARNYRAIVAAADTSASDAEVWQMLCSIIAEQLGVRAYDITQDTDFDKEPVTVRPEIQRGRDADRRWVAACLPYGQNTELPLPYVVEHQ